MGTHRDHCIHCISDAVDSPIPSGRKRTHQLGFSSDGLLPVMEAEKGKHTFARSMYLPNGAKDRIPVRPTKICWRPETSDGITIGIGIIDHDVSCVVGLDLGSEVLDEEIRYGKDHF